MYYNFSLILIPIRILVCIQHYQKNILFMYYTFSLMPNPYQDISVHKTAIVGEERIDHQKL